MRASVVEHPSNHRNFWKAERPNCESTESERERDGYPGWVCVCVCARARAHARVYESELHMCMHVNN